MKDKSCVKKCLKIIAEITSPEAAAVMLGVTPV
jgi:hypothetical protein